MSNYLQQVYEPIASYAPPMASVPPQQQAPSIHPDLSAEISAAVDPTQQPIAPQETPAQTNSGLPQEMPQPQPGPQPTQMTEGPYQFPLQQVVTRSPGGEVDVRAPTVRRAQDVRNDTIQQGINDISIRNRGVAEEEFIAAENHEKRLQAQYDARQAMAAKRQQEIDRAYGEVRDAVGYLSQQGQLDPKRYWGSLNTGQKIAAFAEAFFSGFGGKKAALYSMIDRDIEAQKFAYAAATDRVNAKQNAFSAAMQKFQNEDAATDAVRASAIDLYQANLAKVAARWKGTKAADDATRAMMELEDDKLKLTQNAYRYVAPSVSAQFVDPRTGIVYSNKDAQAFSARVDTDNAEARKQQADIGGKLLLQEGEAASKAGQHQVKLPSGEVVSLPSKEDAGRVRKMATSVLRATKLANEALDIRSNASWIVSPEKRKRLNQIGSELTFLVKDREGLGALSGPDIDLALKATSDPASLSPGTDEALRKFSGSVSSALRDELKTYSSGVSSSAAGVMPSSFRPQQ